jgi:enoyl-CoA hydratase
VNTDTKSELLVGVTDDVLAVTINRPERRNALAMSVLDEICAAFERFADNETIKYATLSGAGDKAFAAGGDLAELQSVRTIESARSMAEQGKRALEAVRNFPAPVIAVLNGAALGGGAELALACDMRVAASHAKIGFVQTRLAIAPAWGGAVELFDLVGHAAAMRMLTRAEILDAKEAHACGIFDRVAAEGESLQDALDAFASPLASQAPHVLRAIKNQAIAARSMSRAARLELETRLLAELWVHPAHWAAADNALKVKK